MRRGLVTATAIGSVILIIGCAGHGDEEAAAPPDVSPSVSASAPRPPTEQELAEQFARNQAANKSFRNRLPLRTEVYEANRPVADRVLAGLQRLRAEQRYDADSIRQVLVDAQLIDVTVRPRGRLDTGGGDGLIFAGTGNRACVFGEHGPTSTTVDIGGPIMDGGCLPAPD
jgi:hypothetical protein